MRVLVLTTQVLFTRGGAEIHAASLVDALRKAGHEADLASIPFKWYPPEKILDHMLACRLLDITEGNGLRADRVIALRFPAYYAPHPCKVLWVMHQHRMAFDLWGGPECDMALDPQGRLVREAVEKAERELIPQSRAVFANSQNVADRLSRCCGVRAEALYHPPRGAERFHGGPSGDWFYYPGRICPLKRQELVLRALAHTREAVKVIFAGRPDNPEYMEGLLSLAKKLHVEDRVRWEGHVTDERSIELYAGSCGVLYPAQDEDYGYVPLEAMLSEKPVVTCTDSGGPLEFIADAENGLVSAPEEEALAAAMDRLWKERAFGTEAGRRGRAKIDEKGITWDNVLKQLLA